MTNIFEYSQQKTITQDLKNKKNTYAANDKFRIILDREYLSNFDKEIKHLKRKKFV